MNKAFIALSFGQSLPDLPPLGHCMPLTAFYCLVEVTLYFIVIMNTLPVFCSNKINGTLYYNSSVALILWTCCFYVYLMLLFDFFQILAG